MDYEIVFIKQLTLNVNFTLHFKINVYICQINFTKYQVSFTINSIHLN